MKKEIYIIEGMSCAACSSAVEKVTRRIDGVFESNVNLMTGKMAISYDESKVSVGDIFKAVDKAGFGIKPEKSAENTPDESENADGKKYKAKIRSLITAVIFSCVLLYISMGQMMVENLPVPDIISMQTHPVNFALTQLLLTLIVIYCGRHIIVGGFKALYRKKPNMNSLVALGCTSSFLYSLVMTYMISDTPMHAHHLYYESAAVVLTLIMLGKTLEERSKQKTKGAIKKLMELVPDTATLVIGESLTEVPTDSLLPEDIVQIKAGEKIPLDAEVVKGESSVDESMLTGESMPVSKQTGDELVGGSVNQNGVLYAKIVRIGDDTRLAKIIKFVEEAQSKKAPISKLADKVAGRFVPIVMAIAVLSAVVWLISGKDFAFTLRVFTSVLVIACPCALGLATPTAIMVGTGLGASKGILIRSGEALETTHKTDTVVFDKTGTLTEGKPTVQDVFSLDGDENRLCGLTALCESEANHPLANAVVEYADSKALKSADKIAQHTNVVGKGIICVLENGRKIIAGNKLLADENDVDVSALADKADSFASKGESVIYVCENGKAMGIIGIADTVRDSSAGTIKQLKYKGIETVIITGDNKRAAEYIGEIVGADKVFSEVLPENKAEIISQLQAHGKTVMMVGDGINDAPALAQADIGCAIGNGSDIAIESADIVLMKNDTEDVCRAIKLSRLTIQNIKENLFWAFCYNTIGIPVAAGVLYPINEMLLSPMLAGLAMSLSSVFVVSNALRLRSKKI